MLAKQYQANREIFCIAVAGSELGVVIIINSDVYNGLSR